ncbi:hypothetical protein HUW51_10840 [Adhaeribacter swui]|uniref:Uncharacterized protein n=1 Tax=Adhaeribacter swui TaxID=2086471 RepID=A0A7G7G7R4_9BACT|nr:hypothetical protein [Adhaeribacter swui]QNF33198.1 hypothetical protein HUW51_10840 [Adhaeribacter swui]
MNKGKLNTTDLRSKILKGIDLAVERLIRKKQKEDGELVFSQNGQVVVVKAKDLTTE